MTNLSEFSADSPALPPDASGIDFSVAGRSLYEWLGHNLENHVLLATKRAFDLPGEPFLVAVVYNTGLPIETFIRRQRRALRIYFRDERPDDTGRLRLRCTGEVDPNSLNPVQAITVIYDPPGKKTAEAEKSFESEGSA